MPLICDLLNYSVILTFTIRYTRGQPVTMNGGCYREMIRDFVIPDLRQNGMEGYGSNKTALHAT